MCLQWLCISFLHDVFPRVAVATRTTLRNEQERRAIRNTGDRLTSRANVPFTPFYHETWHDGRKIVRKNANAGLFVAFAGQERLLLNWCLSRLFPWSGRNGRKTLTAGTKELVQVLWRREEKEAGEAAVLIWAALVQDPSLVRGLDHRGPQSLCQHVRDGQWHHCEPRAGCRATAASVKLPELVIISLWPYNSPSPSFVSFSPWPVSFLSISSPLFFFFLLIITFHSDDSFPLLSCTAEWPGLTPRSNPLGTCTDVHD